MSSIPFTIALRYLLGKKSHAAVNAIAIVSVVGVAVATAAVVCVLSVFNGFQSVISGRLDTMSPDLMVTPIEGKTITNGDSLSKAISKISGVDIATPTLTDNALGFFNGKETPVKLKGVVPHEYAMVTSIDSLLIGSSITLKESEETNPALVSVGVAVKLQYYDRQQPLMVFAPKRIGRFNPANPAAAFVMDSLNVAGTFQSLQEEYDENCIITDIFTVRNLLLYDQESTAVEVKIKKNADIENTRNKIIQAIGNTYEVKDRLMQQQLDFRMIRIEKWMTFLLLFFILIIASFNIISTLSMLVLEKQDSMRTLSAMGLSRGQIASVFRWESVIVSASGAILGLVLGSILCLMQQQFGFITIANGGIEETPMAYPVQLQSADILVTIIPITVIAAICAAVAGTFAKSRIKS